MKITIKAGSKRQLRQRVFETFRAKGYTRAECIHRSNYAVAKSDGAYSVDMIIRK